MQGRRNRSIESETSLLKSFNGIRAREGSTSTSSTCESSLGSNGTDHDSLISEESQYFSVRTGSETYYPNSASTTRPELPSRDPSQGHSRPNLPRTSVPMSYFPSEAPPSLPSSRNRFPSLPLTPISNEERPSDRHPVLLPLQPDSSQRNRGRRSSSSRSSSTRSGTSSRNARSRGESSSFISRRTLILVAILSLIFSFASMCCTGIFLLMRIMPAWRENTFKEGDYESCIPCLQLRESLESNTDEEKFIRKLSHKINDGGEQMCCARTSGQMSVMFQLIIKRSRQAVNITVPESTHKFRFSPVSAHKHLHPYHQHQTGPPKFSSSEEAYSHLKLSPTLDNAREHARNIEVRDNFMIIKYTGWYYIYSSIYFRPNFSKPCKELQEQTFAHFISRLSRNSPSQTGVLTRTSHKCCDNCSDDHHTSYTGGVFLLREGDCIFGQVNGLGLVHFDHDSSFLGLVMLGSWDQGDENSEDIERRRRSFDMRYLLSGNSDEE